MDALLLARGGAAQAVNRVGRGEGQAQGRAGRLRRDAGASACPARRSAYSSSPRWRAQGHTSAGRSSARRSRAPPGAYLHRPGAGGGIQHHPAVEMVLLPRRGAVDEPFQAPVGAVGAGQQPGQGADLHLAQPGRAGEGLRRLPGQHGAQRGVPDGRCPGQPVTSCMASWPALPAHTPTTSPGCNPLSSCRGNWSWCPS